MAIKPEEISLPGEAELKREVDAAEAGVDEFLRKQTRAQIRSGVECVFVGGLSESAQNELVKRYMAAGWTFAACATVNGKLTLMLQG